MNALSLRRSKPASAATLISSKHSVAIRERRAWRFFDQTISESATATFAELGYAFLSPFNTPIG
ncbi:MAG TPA: hypothetical protein VHY37_01070 [Tepidisphaeraceae bacterium]|jgi:hypothetical protein|nr:hypothetical protein [Tepidisphaeraceae bacterium]